MDRVINSLNKLESCIKEQEDEILEYFKQHIDEYTAIGIEDQEAYALENDKKVEFMFKNRETLYRFKSRIESVLQDFKIYYQINL